MRNYSFYIKNHFKKEKTIVFLHGFLENSEIWSDFFDFLSEDFNLIAIDLLGHGKTPSVSETHTMEQMATAVYSVLETEKIENCILVGHSMGGYVSLAFTEKYPEKVSGFILMNSTPFADSEEKKENRKRVVKIIDREKDFFIRNAVMNLFSAENQVVMKEKITKIITLALKTPTDGIKAASLGMKDRPNRAFLFEKPIKKAFILGKNDAVMPSQTLVEFAQETKTPFILLEGGHMSYIENPTQTIAFIKNFADEI